MAEATAQRLIIPLEVRASITLGISGRAWGALVAALLMLGALAFRWLMLRSGIEPVGGPPVDLGFATRVALVAALSIGYSLAIWRWLGVSIAQDLDALGVLPEPFTADTDSIHAVPADQLRKSRLAGLAGMAFFISTIEVPTLIVGGRVGTAWTSLHPLSYMLFLGMVFFWVTGRAAFFSVGRAQVQESLDKLEIDLLDRKPVETFGRIGLRNALIWVIGISLGMLAFVNPELRVSDSLVVLVPLLIVTTTIAGAAMILPMRGLHERIRAAKVEELLRVENAIRGDLSALTGSRIALREPPPSLADLIAYKGLVEAVPEWPFDGGTLRRFGLYLLIPLGSWVGGALVERGVGLLLD